MTEVEQMYANEAQQLGAKLWKRAKDLGLGIRAITLKQYSNLTFEEKAIAKSGWMSWAYCDYGIEFKADCVWLVKKD